jgi:hypothetical protein
MVFGLRGVPFLSTQEKGLIGRHKAVTRPSTIQCLLKQILNLCQNTRLVIVFYNNIGSFASVDV